jgi:hypothetical protein
MTIAPDRPITPDDLRAKFRELEGVAENPRQAAGASMRVAAVVVVVGVVVVAFALGRRRGRKSRTVLEIRRI